MAGGGLEAVEDISSLITFYDNKRKAGAKPETGQIVFTPVPNTERRHHVAEACRADQFGHRTADLNIRLMDDKTDFRPKQRLPIKALSLGENEELVVARAKMRPCLVIAASPGVDAGTLPEGQQRNKALNAFGTIYCLAPIYSVSTANKPTSFGPVMTARIKCMMYPEFVYAPQSGGILQVPGVIRLDRIFWSHLIACSEPQPLFVTSDILGTCWNQLRILFGETATKEFQELRELLLSCLPDHCRIPV